MNMDYIWTHGFGVFRAHYLSDAPFNLLLSCGVCLAFQMQFILSLFTH